MKLIKTIQNLIEKAQLTGEATIRGRQIYGLRGTISKEELYACCPIQEKYKVRYTPNIQELYHWGTLTCRIQNGICIYIYGEGMADVDSIYTFLYMYDIGRYNLGYKTSKKSIWVEDTLKEKRYETLKDVLEHFEYVATYYPKKDILVETHSQEKNTSGVWVDCDVPIFTWIDIKAFEQSFVKERWDDEHRYNYSYHKQGYHHTKAIVHRRDSQGNIVARSLRYFDFEAREKQGREWQAKIKEVS